MKDTGRLAGKENSISLLNPTLRENPISRRLTYNVWTLESEDVAGNELIWNNLLHLRINESDISILGLPPGFSSVDCFQVGVSTEQYKETKIEASARSSVPHTLEYSQEGQGKIDLIVQACETGCQPISNFIPEPCATKEDDSNFGKRAFTMQAGRPWEMAYVSQPKMQLEGVGAPLAQINGRYGYDQTRPQVSPFTW